MHSPHIFCLNKSLFCRSFPLSIESKIYDFSIEVFDSDKIGKDKSLGVIELTPRDLEDNQPKWFLLKGTKSGEILLNMEKLQPGQSPTGYSEQHPLIGGKNPKKTYRITYHQTSLANLVGDW